MNNLITHLIKDGWLKSQNIIDAFTKIKRQDFLPSDKKELSQLNEALPIGFNQTISQPLTVAFMLELLAPQKGDKVLDIGAGSGWTIGLLSHIVGEKGKVFGLEIIPELVQFAKENLGKYQFIKEGRVQVILADGSKGYSQEAPFDKILCSAEVKDSLPNVWKEQLKIGGRIVSPIKNSIWLFEKQKDGSFVGTEYPGFVFVPLVSN